MKKLLYATLAIATISISSCSKFLEEKPASFVSPDAFYKSEGQVVAALNGCYIQLNNIYMHELIIATECVTDLAYINNTSLDARLEMSPAQPGAGDNVWTAAYTGIMICNSTITGIQNSTIAEEKKPAYIGEAVTLRALYYYVLTSMFGDVPFYRDDINSLNTLEKIAKMGRMPAKDTRDSLIRELKEYAPKLPQSRTSDVAQNRVNGPLAYMLIGKMALWNKNYDDCIEAMQSIRKIYGQLAQYPLTDTWFRNKNKPESIFEVQYAWSAAGIKKTTQTACFFTPTKTSGTSTYDGVNIPELGSTGNPYTSATPTEYFMDLYDLTDPRREIILAYTYNGAYFVRPMANNGTGKAWFGPKFWCPGMDNISDGNNMKVFRYADALLMLAEAANEKDDVTTAMSSINEVKRRANPLFELTAFPGKAEFLEEVKRERARELMGEFGRKWDLVRWGTWYDRVKETSAAEFEVFKNNVQPYHIFYPIPDKEVVRSGGALKNEGYK